jgi:hypothetical protein
MHEATTPPYSHQQNELYHNLINAKTVLKHNHTSEDGLLAAGGHAGLGALGGAPAVRRKRAFLAADDLLLVAQHLGEAVLGLLLALLAVLAAAAAAAIAASTT